MIDDLPMDMERLVKSVDNIQYIYSIYTILGVVIIFGETFINISTHIGGYYSINMFWWRRNIFRRGSVRGGGGGGGVGGYANRRVNPWTSDR